MSNDSSVAPAGDGDWTVASGDSMSAIAVATGHFSEALWNLPENAALKEARGDPEVLLPGDKVTVIPIRPKRLPRAAGERYVFRRRGVPVKFTLVLQDDEGNVFAGKSYELAVAGKVYSGTSDDAGKIECNVDPAARAGALTVWLAEPGLPERWVHEVALGALYPIEHTIGVQQRLFNLGFYPGEIDGEAGPATTAAIAAFQTEQQLEPTGEPDEATRKKLVEVHKV